MLGSDIAENSDHHITRTALADTSSVFRSIHDGYLILDSDLKYQLAYAWSLPLNTRFIERMKDIQDAVNRLLPTTEFLNSRIYYLIRQIRQTVMVSYIYPLRIAIDTGLQERIELHRLQIDSELPVFEHDSDSHDDDELPGLID